jgi:hypothetical protein
MSVTANVSAATVVSVDARRKQLHVWTPVIVLVAIVACAIAASLYVDAPLVNASLVGPWRL